MPRTVEPVASNHLVAAAVRSLRLRAGLSQRQLALRMGVARTYVSKIENSYSERGGNLRTLERLAGALGARVCDLLTTVHTAEDDIRELSQDEFISEMIPYMTRLNMAQWVSVLSQVRDLATRRQGKAA
jgi:transcriptional regulator with XRE-family HTH domain